MSRPPLGSELNLFGFHVQWYSLLMMIAVALGIFLAMREEKRLKLPKDTVLNFALLAIPLGIVGARLYYVAFSWSNFSDNLIDILRVWTGGLALYGAVLGGVAAALIVTRCKPSKLAALLDCCAPSLALGQAIGRWGNYANVEAYGARISDPAAWFFPLAVEIRIAGPNGVESVYWHMATFFYESVLCLLIFCVLTRFKTRAKRSGDVTLWYLLMYCAGRAVIEGLRDDSLLINVSAVQVRISQVVSLVACVAVAAVFFARLARQKKLHLGEAYGWALIAAGVAYASVGEFERNAYQELFSVAQWLLAALLAVDALFFVHYFRRARRVRGPAVWMLAGAALCVLTLVLGIGRAGQDNTFYVTLRQSVAMLHVVLASAWFYQRGGAVRRRRRRREALPVEAECSQET